MAQTKEVNFSDLNLTFNPHPVTGKLSVLENNEAVKRSVRNIVLTNHYERPYQPKFGGNIRSQLFESLDGFTSAEIRDDIATALANFEPRAEIYDIVVLPMSDENGFNVSITFRVINQTDPVTVNLFLERVR
tara:strand:+ start:3509 stop:3904 length:396 start_codon:yes stop_codon:yes gene_type:complete